MPVYEHECTKCGRVGTHFSSIAQRRKTPKCPAPCGGKTKIIISVCFGRADIPDYVSPTTGRLVSGRKQRRDDLARSHSRPWEGMEQERKEAARRMSYEEAGHDKQLEDATRRAWHELSPEKRRVLEE